MLSENDRCDMNLSPEETGRNKTPRVILLVVRDTSPLYQYESFRAYSTLMLAKNKSQKGEKYMKKQLPVAGTCSQLHLYLDPRSMRDAGKFSPERERQ